MTVEKQWARGNEWRRNGAPHAQPGQSLQESRGPKTIHKIKFGHRLPPKKHASHRKTQCHIANMDQFHLATPRFGIHCNLGETDNYCRLNRK